MPFVSPFPYSVAFSFWNLLFNTNKRDFNSGTSLLSLAKKARIVRRKRKGLGSKVNLSIVL